MSIDITNKVWLRGPQDAKQRLLLMAIADHANDKGAAYPGVELLAQKSCQSARNALRSILKLEREGWIIVLRRRHGERARGNEYLINLAKLGDEKAVEADNLSRHDMVSPGDELRVANNTVSKPPSDSLSCGEIAPEKVLDEVTKSYDEVTKSTSRGDKTTPCIENRKEPSIEPIPPIAPQGGQVIETADPDGKQRGLWELTNRVRARGGQQPIAWEPWVESQKAAGMWPSRDIAQDPAKKEFKRARKIRPARNSRATIGVFRGG